MNILYPVFALFALTIAVALRLGYLRYTAVAQRLVDPAFFQAYEGDEPARLRIASRHLVNLLELPVLFYVGCLLAFITQQTGAAVITLAWVYVGLRLVHTFIHLGPNVVLWRFRVFIISVVVLVALWATLFLGLVLR